MHANKPKMAKKWEKEEAIKGKLRNLIRQEIKSRNEARLNEAASWGQVKTFLIGILRKKQATKMDGYLVDMNTANAILKVGNALNQSNQKKYGKLPIKKMAAIAWKLVK